MNCERYKAELEDFLYGELRESRAAEIRAHLVACGSCQAMRDELEREHEIFAQYYERTALEPTAEMWDGIRARISAEQIAEQIGGSQPEKSGGWLGSLIPAEVIAWLSRPAVLRQTAFALVLIALSVAVTTFFLKRGDKSSTDIADQGGEVTRPSPQQTVTPTPLPSPSIELADKSPTAEETPRQKLPLPQIRRTGSPVKQLSEQEMLNQQIARAEREYQNAIKMLDRAIAKRKDSLDPQLIKQYESSLALIDSSIAESRRAFRQRPDDPTASQFLLAAYARKVELMQDLAMR